MKKNVLLLRGINVGGHGKLPMADLRAAIEAAGGCDVGTYIQSGNAVFSGDVELDALKAEIASRAGFAPQLLLLDGATFQGIVTANPFPEAVSDHKALHVGFLAELPRCSLDELISAKGGEERIELTESAVYLHTPRYLSGSTLAPRLEKLLGAAMTMRNWRTVETLSHMLDDLK